MTGLTIPQCVELLEATGDYRVVRRFRPGDEYRAYHRQQEGETAKTAVIIDTETTGLEANAKIIELGLVMMSFCPSTGRIFDVGRPHQWFEDPGQPITLEVTAVTGITDDMVAGQRIDDDVVRMCCESADLVIAHNAAFDRPKVERRFPWFAAKHWACSIDDISWKAEGVESSKLAFIAYRLGFFFEGHRAGHDCLALAHALSCSLPVSGRPAIAALLDSARQPTFRVWTFDSPFHVKDALKARGYRWSAGESGAPKGWFKDVKSEGASVDEVRFLYGKGSTGQPIRIGGRDRFSDRALLV